MDTEPGCISLREEDLRVVALWAGRCAERVLPLFEQRAPRDTRPRAATDGTCQFALGGKRSTHLRTLAWAAHSAARECSDPSASAAARAAAYAAATAYTHPVATSHQTKHVLAPAVYMARALELAAGDDPNIGDAALRWATEQASPALRDIILRLPTVASGRSRLHTLLQQLDSALRRNTLKAI